jgi:RNA-splicing ligase RtcB
MNVVATDPTVAAPSDDALVTVFDDDEAPADPDALSVLRQGVAGADLAAPAVVLPDFHLKDDKEMPSSIAVATRETIRPTMTCCSLNCGMALLTLDIGRPGETRIADFFEQVRTRLPFPSNRRDLTVDDVVRCAADGARFAVERFGADPAALERMEEGGRIDVEPFGGKERIRQELPWSVKQLSRLRFGTIGPSNHFVELQQVEEVLDPEAARLLGVEEGQTTLQFHGGGGALTGELGVLFGRRKRYPRVLRAQMAFQKPLYHLASSRSLAQLRRRYQLYFTGGFPPIERDGIEGDRLMLANVMAMNYGYAFRLAVVSILSELLGSSLGVGETRLVVDSPHNTIYDETIDGASAVVHRHNAARAYPASRMGDHPIFGITGQPLLLPGTNRTSSYLCVAGEGAAASLYSVSHGAGSNIKSFVSRGLSAKDPQGRTTLRYRYSHREAELVEQLDDRGVDGTLAILQRHDIVRPVARMRPFAVLN